ncbi:MAG: UPF0175 family protein [Fimbriimonadales bacterium]|nr:UPF0175 family protein [Fimbriimonadales bacterium]
MPPARWLIDELLKQWDAQPERVAQALERALETDPELRWAVVVGAYLDEQISLAKAAELLGMDRWSLQEEFQRRGIPLQIGSRSVDEARAEVRVWQQWSQPPRSS